MSKSFLVAVRDGGHFRTYIRGRSFTKAISLDTSPETGVPPAMEMEDQSATIGSYRILAAPLWFEPLRTAEGALSAEEAFFC